jgi:hypothetical protein
LNTKGNVQEHIGAVKERKKKFEKQTAKFCSSQERYLGLSTKKQDTVLQEVGTRIPFWGPSGGWEQKVPNGIVNEMNKGAPSEDFRSWIPYKFVLGFFMKCIPVCNLTEDLRFSKLLV